MVLAELEIYHSRPVAPTRRVALGRSTLPVEPAPGFGGILLGGIVAANVREIDPDLLPDLERLILQLEHDMRISQPQLRYRLQRDKVGLQRSRHRLLGEGDELSFEFDDVNGEPTQQLLGAVYAAGQLPPSARSAVMGSIRRGIAWFGTIGPELVTVLAGFNGGSSSLHAVSHPVEWALDVLGFAAASVTGSKLKVTETGLGPSRVEIQRAYRRLLIEAHPDHGGEADDAAARIADLSEARRILLG